MLAASMLFSSVDLTVFAADTDTVSEKVSDSNLAEIIDNTSSENIKEDERVSDKESEVSEVSDVVDVVDDLQDQSVDEKTAIEPENLVSLEAELVPDPTISESIPLEDVTTEMSGEDPEWFIESGYFNKEDDIDTASVYSLESNNGPEKSGGKEIRGIDVSKWQNQKGAINWNAVRNSGVEFVFIRAAYRGTDSGSIQPDPYVTENVNGAINAGIRVGLYVFSQALSDKEAVEEANYLVNIAQNYNITMPLVFDYEFNKRLTPATAGNSTSKCLAFCQTVANRGYVPCVYANLSTLTGYINAGSISDKYPIWLARYNSYAGNDVDYTFWQYTSKGSVSGISGDVDCNYWYPPKKTISYDYRGVKASAIDNSGNPTSYYEGYTNGLTLKNPKYGSVKFQGWYSDKECKKKAATTITYKTRGDLKFYTYWTFEVTLDPTIGVMNNMTRVLKLPYGAKDYGITKNYDGFVYDGPSIKDLEPVNAKNQFLGWYYQNPETGEEIKVDTAVVVEKNHTLYAKWKPFFDLPKVQAITSVTGASVPYGTKLELFNEVDNCTIYYTLTTDGSEPEEPTENSLIYNNPIILTQSVKIKAFARKENEYNDSPVLSTSITVDKLSESEIRGDLSEEELKALNAEQLDAFVNNFFWAKDIENQTYTGKKLTPKVSVYSGNKLLEEGKDYKLGYSANVNAGDATVTITGKGSFTGTIIKNFKIVQNDITASVGEIGTIAVAYNRKAQKPSIKLVIDGRTLKANKDYKLDWKNGPYINAGIVDPSDNVVTVTGINNYTGVGTFNFKIEAEGKQPMSKVSVTGVKALEYTGQELKQPDVVVKYGKNVLKENVDYKLEYDNNTNISNNAVVNITALEGSQFFGSKSVKFKITGQSIKNGLVIEGLNSSYDYDGKLINPVGPANIGDDRNSDTSGVSLTIKNKQSEVKLIKGQDYIVTYNKVHNEIKAGRASVTFTGINKYTGSVTKNFTIRKYRLSEDTGNIKVTLLDENAHPVSANYGYKYVKGGVKPTVKVTYKNGNNEEVPLSLNTDYTVKYYNNNPSLSNINRKDPYLVITGKGNFEKSYAAVPFNIVAADFSDVNIVVSDKAANKNPNNYKPSITIYDRSGKKLELKKDYVISDNDYTYHEDYTVETKVKGDNGVRKAGEIVRKTDIIKSGTIIDVKITGVNNYNGSQLPRYRIMTTNISSASCSVKSQYYTGKDIYLTSSDITLTYKGKVLNNSDYQIKSETYANNDKKGTATVEIAGHGIYGGTKKIKFTIAAKPMNTIISYNKNASDATKSMKDTITKSDVNLSANAFARNGYTFDGWMLSPNGLKADYVNKQRFVIDKKYGQTVNLYAKWKPVEYTVTYNWNGGKIPASYPTKYNITGNVELPTITRDGYVFKGWYKDSKFTKPVESFKGEYGNLKLYAKWDYVEYDITYNWNGGTAPDVGYVVKYTTVSKDKLPQPTKNGYNFDGWYKDEGFTTKVAKLEGCSGNLNLYAKYSLATYTITYVPNGGTMPKVVYKTYKMTDNYPLNTIVPTKKGATFVNWYRDPNCKDASTIVTTVNELYGDLTVYAKWE